MSLVENCPTCGGVARVTTERSTDRKKYKAITDEQKDKKIEQLFKLLEKLESQTETK
jgi:hypothetical protein